VPDSLPEVTIYTDGGADPNPGPGGWGAVLVQGLHTREISGADPATTNNRMELTAAIMALRMLRPRCRVQIVTDSQYLRRGITEWVATWQRNGWRTAAKQPVKNQDLWRALQTAMRPHRVTWHWIKGHAGNPLNERADRLAVTALNTLGVTGQPDMDGPAPGLLE